MPAKSAAKKVATAAASTRPSAKQGSTATAAAKPAPQRAAKAKPSKVKQPTPKEAANLAVSAAFQRPVRSGSGKLSGSQPSLPAAHAKSAGQATPVIQAKAQAQAKPAVQTRPANEADTIVPAKEQDGQAGRKARERAAGKWFALSDEDEPPAGKEAEDALQLKSLTRTDDDQRGEAGDALGPPSKRQKIVSKEDEDAGEEASQPGSIDEQACCLLLVRFA